MPQPGILKQLMLGLIYPAVLGTVIYGALEATLAPRVAMWAGRPLPAAVDPHAVFKAALLAITIAFYICDYLYITFTRQFGGLFFIFDLGFLVTLYVTVYAIGLNVGTTNPPNLRVIVVCFAIFIGLYLIWDLIEWGYSRDATERRWYWRVLGWEVLSLLTLGGILAWGSFRPEIVLIALGATTCVFGLLTWQKQRFIGLAVGAAG